jgi:hypothetical protein
VRYIQLQIYNLISIIAQYGFIISQLVSFIEILSDFIIPLFYNLSICKQVQSLKELEKIKA